MPKLGNEEECEGIPKDLLGSSLGSDPTLLAKNVLI